MTTPKPKPPVAPLLKEAETAGLAVAYRTNKWVITGPAPHPPVFIPVNAKEPRALANFGARIRRMATDAAPEEFEMPPTWTTADLIEHAREQGVTLDPSGGVLRATAPQGAEGIVATLHHHEAAVIAALKEPTPAVEPTQDTPADELDLSDPLTWIKEVQARIDKAEEIAKGWEEIAEGEMKAAEVAEGEVQGLRDQRDTADRRARHAEEMTRKAEKRVAELEADLINAQARADDAEAENRALTARLDQVKPQLDELATIKAAFRAIKGGGK
ncbi:hypothetical protein AB0I81_39955 [Nonomuraea sp. NPDC050404]|uniref:hypothetical protein n=1 Tax=Nonomuraea sp. NPDC050404 TaxID=3155783 RepID=UPI0033FA8691